MSGLKRSSQATLGLGALMLLASASACVSARTLDSEATAYFRSRQYQEASERLRAGLKEQGEKGRDLLLYSLDLALALHSAGKYDEAIQEFLKSDRIAEIKDYTSLAQEGASLLTGENSRDYRAEEFENVLISTYLAMDYALLGQDEDARVEARRVNRKLHLMVSEGGRTYQQNAFARYLSAILYEQDRDWDNAYIDLKEVEKLSPGLSRLGLDLWRVAGLAGFREDQARWAEKYALSEQDFAEARALHPRLSPAEIIVFYENGIGPEKVPNPNFHMVPVFASRPNPAVRAQVEVDGVPRGQTELLYDIEAIAKQNLDEKYAALVAKRVGGLVVKEVVANQVARATGSEALGDLTRFALFLTDQADLRSWGLLPKELHLARFRVEPGMRVVRLTPLGAAGQTFAAQEKTVEVKPGEKVFIQFRYTP